MNIRYTENDYVWIKELLTYPEILDKELAYFENTSEISIPKDPVERVIFQDRAKEAIRKIAQNNGHILMVGNPGTGKSMLANMFKEVLERSIGEFIRPKKSIVAYPGKDKNHIKFAYEDPTSTDQMISNLHKEIDLAKNNSDDFSLAEQIYSVSKVRKGLLVATIISAFTGIFFPTAFIITGITGIGSIFMYMQENNHKAQEKIQQNAYGRKDRELKKIYDQMPEVLYDPRKDIDLMISVSEPDSRNMKGGFRHDPYQSGNLHTPPHQRAYLGAHAKAPIIYIDELKTLVKAGYMPDLLEIMQNKEYVLEGGRDTGSGAADRSENKLKAENIIVASCNYDTLDVLRNEGDGAFLSRIEDKGEIIHMQSAIPETPDTIRQVAQYIKQEVINLGKEFKAVWGEIIEKEGYDGVRNRSEKIFGKALPKNYELQERDFSRKAVMEIVKDLRCRSSNRKLSCMLRPMNGIIKAAEFEAILDNSALVEPNHVFKAIKDHMSLEGLLNKESLEIKKDLKKYISSLTDSIGYVVGLAIVHSRSSGQMIGQPLPIHCQISIGGMDMVIAPGKTGEIAKAAAQHVRASIKKIFKRICAPYVGYEMHIEYIQSHEGVEGDSSSVAIDVALISDYIQQPVNQRYGVTGSLTGDIVLAVGGVTEKIRSIMDINLGMKGACIPWQNKYDIEPLLLNTQSEYIQSGVIPGIRIFRHEQNSDPFDVFFCKTKYDVYEILMGLDRETIESRMADRSRIDLDFNRRMGEPQSWHTREHIT